MPTNDDRLDELQDRWLAAVAAGREPAVADLCPDLPDLLPELEERVAVLRRFDRLAAESAPAAGPAAPPDTPRYRFLGFVARGGMGEVWRAHDAELGREVAVKVLRGAADGPPAEFRAEARLVARLEHPGIVPVYVAGVLTDGRPFFAMKLVRGGPGPAGADAPPPTLAELLGRRASPADDLPRFVQVFQQACEAVAYAHALSPPVLHRDLKPSNIMVGSLGEVLVMDWGIAKVLGEAGPSAGAAAAGVDTGRPADTDPDRTAADQAGADTADGPSGPNTRTGEAKGTLAYMPPEQARGDRRAVGPASDVFGLGGVLCAILTGRPPFVGPALAAFERARAGDLADAFARLDRCGADARLVGIARRCLVPDPADRYPDAGHLARAVGEYRAGVENRLRRAELDRAQAEVRTQAERRRRKTQLVFGTAVVVALAAGAALSAWQARRATTAKDETAHQLVLTQQAEATAVEQRNAAVEQERLATRVKEVFQDVLAQSTPDMQIQAGAAPNPNVTVKEAIDNTLRQIEGRFGDQPFVEAEIRSTLGEVSAHLGNYVRAEEQLRLAQDLYRRSVGPSHPKALESQFHLGMVLCVRRKAVSAQEVFGAAFRTATERYGPDHRLTIKAQFGVGTGYLLTERTRAEGERLMTEALAGWPRATGVRDATYACWEWAVANHYFQRRQFDRAEPLLREALAIQRDCFGPQHHQTLLTLYLLGHVFVHAGHDDRAEPLLVEAAAGLRVVCGEEHQDTFRCLDVLAQVYMNRRQWAEAERVLAPVAASRRKAATGGADPFTMGAVLELASVYLGLQRFADAEGLFREATATLEGLGHSDFSFYSVQMGLGAALLGQKKYPEAEAVLTAAYQGMRRPGTDLPAADIHSRLGECARFLADLSEQTGKPAEAARWKAEAAKYADPDPRSKGKD